MIHILMSRIDRASNLIPELEPVESLLTPADLQHVRLLSVQLKTDNAVLSDTIAPTHAHRPNIHIAHTTASRRFADPLPLRCWGPIRSNFRHSFTA